MTERPKGSDMRPVFHVEDAKTQQHLFPSSCGSMRSVSCTSDVEIEILALFHVPQKSNTRKAHHVDPRVWNGVSFGKEIHSFAKSLLGSAELIGFARVGSTVKHRVQFVRSVSDDVILGEAGGGDLEMALIAPQFRSLGR